VRAHTERQGGRPRGGAAKARSCAHADSRAAEGRGGKSEIVRAHTERRAAEGRGGKSEKVRGGESRSLKGRAFAHHHHSKGNVVQRGLPAIVDQEDKVSTLYIAAMSW
jgi:hypothetical protein